MFVVSLSCCCEMTAVSPCGSNESLGLDDRSCFIKRSWLFEQSRGGHTITVTTSEVGALTSLVKSQYPCMDLNIAATNRASWTKKKRYTCGNSLQILKEKNMASPTQSKIRKNSSLRKRVKKRLLPPISAHQKSQAAKARLHLLLADLDVAHRSDGSTQGRPLSSARRVVVRSCHPSHTHSNQTRPCV